MPPSTTPSTPDRTGPSRTVSLPRMQAFSGGDIGGPGWPAINIHTDPARAAASGLDAPIASGIQAEGYLLALVLEEFGEDWFHGGTLTAKHIGMLSPGDVAVAKLSRRAPTDSRTATVDVRCECPDGRTIVLGEATGAAR